MADLKKVASNLSSVGKIAGEVVGIADSVDSLATLATPVIEHVIETRKTLIMIPELYGDDFSMGLEQAKELLDHYGLRHMEVALNLNEAKEDYRNCFDSQVVDSKPKQKQKVQPNTVVVLRYVTSEVVEESQRLFEESEKEKEEAEAIKSAKKLEQKEKAKHSFLEFSDKAKGGIGKIFNSIKNHNSDTDEASVPSDETEEGDNE